MRTPINTCPIWGSDYAAEGWRFIREGVYLVEDSPRAGCAYELPEESQDEINDLGDAEKARLTTWLIDQHERGTKCPVVQPKIIKYAEAKSIFRLTSEPSACFSVSPSSQRQWALRFPLTGRITLHMRGLSQYILTMFSIFSTI